MTIDQTITIAVLVVQAIATVVLVFVAALAWRAADRQAQAAATSRRGVSTRDVTDDTPWSWRFESLAIDPGATNGPPLTVEGPRP